MGMAARFRGLLGIVPQNFSFIKIRRFSHLSFPAYFSISYTLPYTGCPENCQDSGLAQEKGSLDMGEREIIIPWISGGIIVKTINQ